MRPLLAQIMYSMSEGSAPLPPRCYNSLFKVDVTTLLAGVFRESQTPFTPLTLEKIPGPFRAVSRNAGREKMMQLFKVEDSPSRKVYVCPYLMFFLPTSLHDPLLHQASFYR